jgi:hypothetical protein
MSNGSAKMVQQFIHGTQCIDELVIMRVKDKGDRDGDQDVGWTDKGRVGTTCTGRRPSGVRTVFETNL